MSFDVLLERESIVTQRQRRRVTTKSFSYGILNFWGKKSTKQRRREQSCTPFSFGRLEIVRNREKNEQRTDRDEKRKTKNRKTKDFLTPPTSSASSSSTSSTSSSFRVTRSRSFRRFRRSEWIFDTIWIAERRRFLGTRNDWTRGTVDPILARYRYRRCKSTRRSRVGRSS